METLPLCAPASPDYWTIQAGLMGFSLGFSTACMLLAILAGVLLSLMLIMRIWRKLAS